MRTRLSDRVLGVFGGVRSGLLPSFPETGTAYASNRTRDAFWRTGAGLIIEE